MEGGRKEVVSTMVQGSLVVCDVSCRGFVVGEGGVVWMVLGVSSSDSTAFVEVWRF